jgi:putative DNA primase/helicase
MASRARRDSTVNSLPPEPTDLTWEEMVKTEPRLGKLLKQVQSVDTSEICFTQHWFDLPKGLKQTMKKLVGFEAKGDDRLRTRAAYDIAYKVLFHDAPPCRCPGCNNTFRQEQESAYSQWRKGMDERKPDAVVFEQDPFALLDWNDTLEKNIAVFTALPENTQLAITAKLPKREDDPDYSHALGRVQAYFGLRQFVIDDGKLVDEPERVDLASEVLAIVDKIIIERSSPSILQDMALVKQIKKEWEEILKRKAEDLQKQVGKIHGRFRELDYFIPKTFAERRIKEAMDVASDIGNVGFSILNGRMVDKSKLNSKDASTGTSASSVSSSTEQPSGQPPDPTTPRPSRLVLVRGSDVKPQELHWLWQGHLLRGSQELTTGLPGLGKSQVQCSMVACCTACLPWPDGTAALNEPVNVIMLTAEDSIAQGLVPRLIAAGANMDMVHIVECIRRDNKDRQFLLSQDLLDLFLTIKEVGNVGLVTIDPITAYMGGKMDSHKSTEVRAQLGPLKDLADRCDVAISTITHPAKSAGPRAIDHFIGSQAFIAAGRIGHGCFAETELNEITGEKKPTGRNLFAHVKHSMSVQMPTLAYHIVGDIEIESGITTSRVVWDGEVDITADAAVAGAVASKGTVRTDEQKRAADFLCEILEDGPVPQNQVEEEGEQRGISKKVLRTMRDKLGVVSERKGFGPGGQWEWSLPPAKSS